MKRQLNKAFQPQRSTLHSLHECACGASKECGTYQNEELVGLQLRLGVSSGGWSCHIFFRSSRHKGTWGPPFLLSVLELPETQLIPYSALHGICGPFFYYYSRLFCFILFWTISLFLSLSTLSTAAEDLDHWPPTLQLKLQYFQLGSARNCYLIQSITSVINKTIKAKLSLCQLIKFDAIKTYGGAQIRHHS